MPDTTPTPAVTWSKPVVRKLSAGANSEIGEAPGAVENYPRSFGAPAS